MELIHRQILQMLLEDWSDFFELTLSSKSISPVYANRAFLFFDCGFSPLLQRKSGDRGGTELKPNYNSGCTATILYI